jgi:predicted DNA-binding mobile mystery protein A
MKAKQLLQIEQMDRKLSRYKSLITNEIPRDGWIKAIRTTLGMSLRQLGSRLQITPQSVSELEKREKNRTITLQSLQEAGEAMNMTFVYGFVPKEGSIHSEIEKKARETATAVVMRTAVSMDLESQSNSAERLRKAIKTRTDEILQKLPRYLWD